MGARRRGRELALQMLYRRELTGASFEQMQADFEDWKGVPDEARRFATFLVEGAVAHLEEIDRELGVQTAHWRLERLAAVDRNILRVAIFELLHNDEVPAAVVIDEAIEIAKKFGAEDSARFVNGVLDGFFKRKLDQR